jgi:hypothetical protein
VKSTFPTKIIGVKIFKHALFRISGNFGQFFFLKVSGSTEKKVAETIASSQLGRSGAVM